MSYKIIYVNLLQLNVFLAQLLGKSAILSSDNPIKINYVSALVSQALKGCKS